MYGVSLRGPIYNSLICLMRNQEGIQCFTKAQCCLKFKKSILARKKWKGHKQTCAVLKLKHNWIICSRSVILKFHTMDNDGSVEKLYRQFNLEYLFWIPLLKVMQVVVDFKWRLMKIMQGVADRDFLYTIVAKTNISMSR